MKPNYCPTFRWSPLPDEAIVRFSVPKSRHGGGEHASLRKVESNVLFRFWELAIRVRWNQYVHNFICISSIQYGILWQTNLGPIWTYINHIILALYKPHQLKARMAQDFATFRLVAVHERPPDLGGLGRTMITSGWGKNVDEICGNNVAKKPVIHLFQGAEMSKNIWRNENEWKAIDDGSVFIRVFSLGSGGGWSAIRVWSGSPSELVTTAMTIWAHGTCVRQFENIYWIHTDTQW